MYLDDKLISRVKSLPTMSLLPTMLNREVIVDCELGPSFPSLLCMALGVSLPAGVYYRLEPLSTGRLLFHEIIEVRTRVSHIRFGYQSRVLRGHGENLVSYAATCFPTVLMEQACVCSSMRVWQNHHLHGSRPEIDIDDFFPAMRATMTVGDDMCGIPYNVTRRCCTTIRTYSKRAAAGPDGKETFSPWHGG